MIGSQNEIAVVLRALKDQPGWTYLYCDNPRKALRGFHIFRPIDPDNPNDGEEELNLQWSLFDTVLEPDIERVKAEEMFDFIERTGKDNLVLCDDPRRRLIGFARYEPESGKVIVREISITDIKNMGEGRMEAFMKLREDLKGRIPAPQTVDQFLAEHPVST